MTDETGAATPITADLVRGALELEPTDRGLLLHRLPARARAQAGGDGQLLMAESHPGRQPMQQQPAVGRLQLERPADEVGGDRRGGTRLVGHAPSLTQACLRRSGAVRG